MIKFCNINTSFWGYQDLINAYNSLKYSKGESIQIGIHNFFSANMSAVLGAIMDLLIKDLNQLNLLIDPRIQVILKKNQFLTYYGFENQYDFHNTTVRFQKLSKYDGKYFKEYVIQELINGQTKNLPKLSPGLRAKIIEVIYEIFVNAKSHSETEFIYTCGQFFPKISCLEFTIVDTGIGMRERVNNRFGTTLDAVQAISWAIEENNTTKIGIPGGLGLHLLKELISLNGGKMQIISNDGFYEFSKFGIQTSRFPGDFPGTIVNLQFKTDDTSNYSLVGEVDLKSIF